jgi:hypothetical protein
MDLLSFVAKLVEALAWPTAVFAIVLLLRKELRKVVPLLKKLKAGPLEAEFEQEVQELRAQAQAQAEPGKTTLPLDTPERQKLLQLAQLNPRSAIIEAWQLVEFAAAELAKHGSLRELFVESSELLTRGQVILFSELRALRNQAAHDPGFSPSFESAVGYVDLALRLRAGVLSAAEAAKDG